MKRLVFLLIIVALFFTTLDNLDAASKTTKTKKTRRAKVTRVVGKAKVVLTGYCPCAKCCGKRTGKTALGDNAWVLDGVAADFKFFPPRTRVKIPGIGIREVDDWGAALRSRKNNYKIDVRFKTHAEAKKFGRVVAVIEVLPQRRGKR